MPPSPRRLAAPRLSLLHRLCDAAGVSGDESEVRKIVLEELRSTSDEVKVDALGNVLITRKGTGRRRLRVMVDAHMDEVGFMIVAEAGDGIYEFAPIGDLDLAGLAGKPVVVGGRRLPGVVGAKAVHLSTIEELKQPIAADTLRVDLGLGGKVSIGDRGTFAPNFQLSGPVIMSKALDNRLGVSLLIDLVRDAPPNIDLLAAFTVQEEIGMRGAQVAAAHFDPDVAIVLDATPAKDMPMQRDAENTFYNSRLGCGPAIYVQNKSALDDRRLVDFMMRTAARARIACQVRQPGGGGTDAGVIQSAGQGVPVISVSVPHRYSHTAMSVARVEDFRNTYALISAALRRMKPELLA